ncbi:MAG: hypothetical protein A3F31_04600 [Candidatus Levybacteria bacterium RIFCSPHIGHO2_12_FULL_38_12]|nr:MAG: hypothetical protein A2770_04285 [Candidatus Levybacteria bacterium RIFCSPHIGHO2_01_FULL_38_12]OGH21810.1 MAG: hypothetical protein A3D75_01305 [Candidatus Levybacteria bacterium RIFCSPHIGHO2_02_FULL_37_18]OGH22533.1 MAG: hypothetical protein A3F31_04600 [Candidatus Levybacteria bacterium RIFCSPHIGHO2_12_FULL_38_12]OGH33431.1 MAG: hypothetical protein A3A47_04255 [Candidatus Levybacteria bacterium RIFCSPLOWO2_01_FULL_37_20]OGH44070.1 MAG: hypothetical protein A3J14_04970 [Candidatus Lev
MDTTFFTEDFFDTSDFPFADLFVKDKKAWEVLGRLQEYIISLFENGVVQENYQGKKHVYIGEGTEIFDGAFVTGPCIIGKNSIIGHSAFLRENCVIGDSVHIGHGVEVKNSLMFNGSCAAHLNYIGDSIIGNKVNIAGGAILANFRFDQKPISIKHKEKIIETGLTKFGAIIGDSSQIGVNAVLNPGTILGKGCLLYPLTSVRGVYEQNSIIK